MGSLPRTETRSSTPGGFLSNTNHEEDQPIHLSLKDSAVPTAHT